MKNEKMEKTAQLIADAVGSNQFDVVKTAFADASNDYILRYCQEESFAEKILTPETILDPKSHPQIQVSMDSDDFYYWNYVETGARAMEVAVRGVQEAKFVDSEKWTMQFAPIETDPVKKPYEEMLVAPRLLDMIRKNNAEEIRKKQDERFMRLTHLGMPAANKLTADWNDSGTFSLNKTDIVRLRNAIKRYKLNPTKLLMSEFAWEYFFAAGHEDIGPMIGELFFGGVEGKGDLAGNSIIKTNKTDLSISDAVGTFDTNSIKNCFDFTTLNSGTTRQYITIYAFADESFLGRMAKLGQDQTYAKWEGHIFDFYSRRNIAMGFGDTRGMAKLVIEVPVI